MSKTAQELPKTARRPSQVKHGISTFLRTGTISPSVRGFRRIQKYLREIERDLTSDLGGPDNLTAAKEMLVKSTIQAYGVLLLAGAYTQRHSILDPVKARQGVIELQPVLGHQYIAFLNCIRQNLITLGLDRRRVEEPLDLGKYIAARDAEKAQSQAGLPAGEVSETLPVSTSRKDQGKDRASRVRIKGGGGQASGEGIEPGPAREGKAEEGGDEGQGNGGGP